MSHEFHNKSKPFRNTFGKAIVLMYNTLFLYEDL